MTQKDVTGVICLPLPPLNRGRHTLNCVYTDGKYNTKNRCFQIQVVSATPVISGGNGEEGRPNTTVHFVIEVKNEAGIPVQDGQVKMYYNSQQENQWAEEAEQEQDGVELDSVNIVNDGRATLDYAIPNDFRAGIVNLRFRYDLSHEGYDATSVVIPVFVYRDGDIELEFKYGTTESNAVPIDISYDDIADETYYNMLPDNKLFCYATLYDGTDAGRVPIKNVPINFKMNTGTIANVTTNNVGVAKTNTPTITNSTTSFTISTKNEAKRYIGSTNKSQDIWVAKQAVLLSCHVETVYNSGDQTKELSVTVIATDENNVRLSGRPVMIKLNESSVPENGNFSNPDHTLTVRTDTNGEAVLHFNDIHLTQGNNYLLEVNVGGGFKVIGVKKELGNIKWGTGTNSYTYQNGTFSQD